MGNLRLQLGEAELDQLVADMIIPVRDASRGHEGPSSGHAWWSTLLAMGLAPPNGRKAPQPTILVAESDDSLRDFLSAELIRHGFLVLPAATGGDALNQLRTPLAPIDVMLLDLHLPDVSGLDLCQRIQELHEKLPVIVCTGQGDPAQVVPLLPAGMRYYWQKPIEPNSLVAAVSLLIRRTQRGPQEPGPDG
jgi:CheY-like chemotaxis protein